MLPVVVRNRTGYECVCVWCWKWGGYAWRRRRVEGVMVVRRFSGFNYLVPITSNSKMAAFCLLCSSEEKAKSVKLCSRNVIQWKRQACSISAEKTCFYEWWCHLWCCWVVAIEFCFCDGVQSFNSSSFAHCRMSKWMCVRVCVYDHSMTHFMALSYMMLHFMVTRKLVIKVSIP